MKCYKNVVPEKCRYCQSETIKFGKVHNMQRYCCKTISPAYNGNIASQSWGTSGSPNTTSTVYYYDKLNRLLTGNNTAGYTENNIAYDQMGNITAMYRYMPTSTLIDNLTYSYTVSGNPTNQLQSVADAMSNNAVVIKTSQRCTTTG